MLFFLETKIWPKFFWMWHHKCAQIQNTDLPFWEDVAKWSKIDLWNKIIVWNLTSKFASICLQSVVGVSSLTSTLTPLFSSITLLLSNPLLAFLSSPTTMIRVLIHTSPKNRPLTPSIFWQSIMNSIEICLFHDNFISHPCHRSLISYWISAFFPSYL